MRKVGLFEAKTHLSALVDAAERGETIVVTRNGKPVAQLGPIRSEKRRSMTRKAAVDQIFAFREQLRREDRTFTANEIRQWIEEGRRF